MANRPGLASRVALLESVTADRFEAMKLATKIRHASRRLDNEEWRQCELRALELHKQWLLDGMPEG